VTAARYQLDALARDYDDNQRRLLQKSAPSHRNVSLCPATPGGSLPWFMRRAAEQDWVGSEGRGDRGNTCLTCDHFATDARHLAELQAQLATTEELIQARQAQDRQGAGAEMGPGHVWLTERNAELARCGRSSPRSKPGHAAARSAALEYRPGRGSRSVTLNRKLGNHGDAR
jgi:hypothetical protein